MQESGEAPRRQEAVDRLLHLLNADPDNERIYFNLGMLAMDMSEHRRAEDWFRKVRNREAGLIAHGQFPQKKIEKT